MRPGPWCRSDRAPGLRRGADESSGYLRVKNGEREEKNTEDRGRNTERRRRNGRTRETGDRRGETQDGRHKMGGQPRERQAKSSRPAHALRGILPRLPPFSF